LSCVLATFLYFSRKISTQIHSRLNSIRFGFILFFLLFALQASASCDGDTVKAKVKYGDDYLFRKAGEKSDDFYDSILDSLRLVEPRPADKINEILLYKSIQHKTQEDIAAIIDSLFDLDKVPYALINEINLFVAEQPLEIGVFSNFVFVPTDTTPYPAQAFYNNWNNRNPHPYPSALSAADSSMYLLLCDELWNCGFSKPFDRPMKVTSRFGYRDGRNHNGIDLDLRVGDSVKTVFAGKVRYARFHEGYGRLVIVRHHNGLETFYAHLHRLKVEAGDEVEAGQVVGLGGSSGHSTGSHLHFEMRFKGIPLNPEHLIVFKDSTTSLLGDTLVLKKQRHSYTAYRQGTVFHTVQRGDYLSKIAKRYGVQVAYIREINGMTRNSHLRVGQQLRVSEKEE